MARKRQAVVITSASLGNHALDHGQMPDHAREDFCRLIFGGVRKFFSDPSVQRDYEKWLAEYRKTHPITGGEMC